MRKAIKGASLSGLVCPGLGQLVLKRYVRGLAFMLPTLLSIALIVVKALRIASDILEKINPEGGADMNAITNAATQACSASDSLEINIATAVIIICWIGGAIDAYMVGRKMDSENPIKDQTAA